MGMSLLMRQRDWHYQDNPDIKWNFTKFLVNREGAVVARFEPTTAMSEVEASVAACLKAAT